MSRIVSLVVLIAIIVLMGLLFLRVMWSFWLPLFLAVLMALVFRPMYRWFLVRLRGYEYLAAGLTTCVIFLVVFVPLIWVFTVSVVQCVTLVTDFDNSRFQQKVARARASLGLEMPFPNDFKAIDAHLLRLDGAPKAMGSGSDHVAIVGDTLRVIWRLQQRLADANGAAKKKDEELIPPWESRNLIGAKPLWLNPAIREVWREPTLLKEDGPAPYNELTKDTLVKELAEDSAVVQFWKDGLVRPLGDLADAKLDDSNYSEYHSALQRTHLAFQNFRQQRLGDPLRAWFLNFLNPSDAEISQLHASAMEYVTRNLKEITIPTTQVLTDLMIAGGVMILGVFYFFADGPHMVTTMMQLWPLEQRYQRQLLEQFDQMSRVVVVANLVNAVAHGIAAAIGYYFAGVESWILLSTITMGLSLLPFIGAASVWTPCCVWLWLYDERVGAAIFLFIYGSTILNLVDYGLRPWLLHGQANIHPLLAFMSILGGVQTLGPIGILVGPMIVVFLQTLLTMLQAELGHLDEEEDTLRDAATETASAATSVDSALGVSSDETKSRSGDDPPEPKFATPSRPG